jgi:hypothetical protein
MIDLFLFGGQVVFAALFLWTHARYRRERAAFEREKRFARTMLGIEIGHFGARGSNSMLLRLLDANRPAGVSLRTVVRKLSETLEKGGYPT